MKNRGGVHGDGVVRIGEEELNKLKFWEKKKLFQGMKAQGLCIESNKKHRGKKKTFLIKKDAWFKKKFFKAVFQNIYQ